MQQNKTKKISRTFVVRKFLGWLAIRLSVLIVFFVLLESVYRFGGLAAFGDANVEIIYGTIQKILFSLTVWFFLATSKKIIIPATIISVSPALGKLLGTVFQFRKQIKP